MEPTTLERAERIAREAHKGQYRKMGDDKGKPYIIHPERVAGMFDKCDSDADWIDDCKAIAWLHDVIEDTSVTADRLLSKGVPDHIVQSVVALTKVEGEFYPKYLDRVKSDQLARLVKIADIQDNLKSLKRGSLRDKYCLALLHLEGGVLNWKDLPYRQAIEDNFEDIKEDRDSAPR
jgi:(p)ppGpp synthase/HD superfamily hydrolase